MGLAAVASGQDLSQAGDVKLELPLGTLCAHVGASCFVVCGSAIASTGNVAAWFVGDRENSGKDSSSKTRRQFSSLGT
jgi:hypothetical protein